VTYVTHHTHHPHQPNEPCRPTQDRRPAGRLLLPALLALIAGSTLAPAQDRPPVGDRDEPGLDAPAAPLPTDGAADPAAIASDNPDEVNFSAFAEPVELTTLIELVAKTLNINITVKEPAPVGSVSFNAPVPVRKAELLDFLDALLAQQNFAITRDRFGFYTVRPAADVDVNLASDGGTTRIFSTPNIRPSALRTIIAAQLGVAPGDANAQSGQRQIAYIDELGVIVATDTPRRLAAIRDLIDSMLAQYATFEFTRIDLRFIAASVARERALQLIGQAPQTANRPLIPGQEQVQQPAPAQGVTGVFDNLGDRLRIDPTGNALIFRGLPAEVAVVREVIALIDVSNTLIPRSYFGGSAAAQIADLARQQGLGEVTTIELQTQFNPNFGYDFNAIQQQLARQNSGVGGPVMVVDKASGTIVYYGTPEQQEQLAGLIREFKPQDERVTIGVYKLRNSDAEDVAEVILGLIQNTTPLGEAPLLGDGSAPGTTGRFRNRRSINPDQNRLGEPGVDGQPATADDGLSLDGEESFVVADVANNQILVKAPQGQQADFAKLIDKLDLRRPQVYIEAKIVAVTWSDSLRLAFETQLINANGTGGAFNTNFGLGTLGNNLNTAKTVATGLGGLTAALIKSDQVPIIINALQSRGDSQILSSPQLLVDDNEEATIVSVDSQPTTAISRTTGNPDVTSFAGYEDAGTTLTVQPQISDSGYLRLRYEAELSSFTGNGVNGIPPPRQTNTVSAESVTIPSDSTVVVGGLTLDSRRKNIAQVPLLGDIPIIGALFQDRDTSDRKTTLYIFLTPRVLRDPSFADLRLITRGPQARSNLGSDIPTFRPTLIDMGASTTPPPTAPAFAPAATPIDPVPAGSR